MSHLIQKAIDSASFLKTRSERAITGYQYVVESPKRILFNFLTSVAKMLMQDFMKLILIVVLLFGGSIIAAFYPDQWMWKLATFAISFILSLLVLIVLHHRWIINITLHSFKEAVITEGKNIVSFINSPDYDETIDDLSMISSLFDMKAIQNSVSDMPSKTLQQITKTKTVQRVFASEMIRNFVDTQAQKIQKAVMVVVNESKQRSAAENGMIDSSPETDNSERNDEVNNLRN